MWTGLSRPIEHNSFDLICYSTSAIYVPARPHIDDDELAMITFTDINILKEIHVKIFIPKPQKFTTIVEIHSINEYKTFSISPLYSPVTLFLN